MKKGFTHESFTNQTVEWYSPREIFDTLGVTFDMDVCSPGADIVPWIPALKHLTIKEDGLKSEWSGLVWCNPPYGGQVGLWLEKLKKHNNGIALVFSRTDANWFHYNCNTASGLLFIKQRLKFVRQDMVPDYIAGRNINSKGCGAGSLLIAYGEEALQALQRAKQIGTLLRV